MHLKKRDICQYFRGQVCSYIYQHLTVAPFSTAALSTSRPMRPKPLMPIFPAGMVQVQVQVQVQVLTVCRAAPECGG